MRQTLAALLFGTTLLSASCAKREQPATRAGDTADRVMAVSEQEATVSTANAGSASGAGVMAPGAIATTPVMP